MKLQRLSISAFLAVVALILLISSPWVNGCGNNDPVGTAASRPAPPYDWADPQLGARLDEALRLWAEDFGIYGAAAAVLTPGWLNWSGSTGVQDIAYYLLVTNVKSGTLAQRAGIEKEDRIVGAGNLLVSENTD